MVLHGRRKIWDSVCFVSCNVRGKGCLVGKQFFRVKIKEGRQMIVVK